MLLLTALSACTEDSERTTLYDTPQAIEFDTYLVNNDKASGTRAGSVGVIDNAKLKTSGYGFGVFAIHHADNTYAYNGADTGNKRFNFMYNEPMTWNSTALRWEYAPVKYWPNGTDEDNSDNSPSNTATANPHPHYVSFFAYAPYVSGTSFSGDGITAITANSENTGASYVNYTMSAPTRPADLVDLLWSARENCYKDMPSGEGFVNGKVKFVFKHGLPKLTIKVQGFFDHGDPDNSTLYPDNVNENTKILIQSVEIVNPQMYTEGKMFFAPRPDDSQTPYWELNTSTTMTTTFASTDIDDNLRYTTGNPQDESTAAEAQTQFSALPEGVTHTVKPLFTDDDNNSDTDPWYIIMPSAAEQLQVRIVYYVITYDERLVLNNPKYFSIVRNDITSTAENTDASFRFEPNKQYTLLLKLGLTTVKFEVVEVEDWAIPLVLDAVVTPFGEQTQEANVE